MTTAARHHGFTLIEVLVAITLIMALIGSLFGFFWDVLSVRQRVLEESARRRAAETLIERVERDMMSCLVGDAVLGAGVSGDEFSLRLLTRSVPVRLAERGAADPEVFSDLERSEYRFEPGQHEIHASRSVAVPARSSSARTFSLGGSVHRVRFRYHDGTRWRDEFDSLREDRLPRAIELAVWYEPSPGEVVESSESGDEDLLDPMETEEFDGGFDEVAFAELSDMEFDAEPMPDRIRIIIVPDSAGEEDAGAFSEEDPRVARLSEEGG